MMILFHAFYCPKPAAIDQQASQAVGHGTRSPKLPASTPDFEDT
jgi:hypothetical protein